MELNKPITSIIIVAITGILLFLFVLPEYHQSRQLGDDVIRKTAQLNGQSTYYANIKILADNLAKRPEALIKIDSALPTEFSVAPLMYFFQQKGQKTGGIIKSIMFNDSPVGTSKPSVTAAEEKKVRTITFNINLLGTYQSLKNFLLELEKSSRMFEVSTISFSSVKSLQGFSQPGGQNAIYEFKLDIKTHAY